MAITLKCFMGSGWLLNLAKRLCQQCIAIQFMILKVWDFQDHAFYLLAHEWINISFQVHELHLEVHELINLWNFMNCHTIHELWVHEFKFMNIFKFINLNKFMKFMKLFYRGCILGFASDNLYFVHTQAASNGCKRHFGRKTCTVSITYLSKYNFHI